MQEVFRIRVTDLEELVDYINDIIYKGYEIQEVIHEKVHDDFIGDGYEVIVIGILSEYTDAVIISDIQKILKAVI